MNVINRFFTSLPRAKSRNIYPVLKFLSPPLLSRNVSAASSADDYDDSFSTKLKRWIQGDKRDAVAVLRLTGPIEDSGFGGGRRRINLNSYNKQIEKSFKVRNLKAVCLQINSPGGSAVQSELVAKRIRSLADKKGVKVYAFIEDAGASGGYFIACAADEIYASESSIVGSIGVLSYTFGLQDVIRRWGVERRVRTAGENKLLADSFTEDNEKNAARVDRTLRAIHDHFIAFVKASRGSRIVGDESDVFSGEFWTGKGALEQGLVDGIDDMDSFVAKKFGPEVKVQRIKATGQGLAGLLNREAAISTFVGEFFDQLETRAAVNDAYSRFRIKF